MQPAVAADAQALARDLHGRAGDTGLPGPGVPQTPLQPSPNMITNDQELALSEGEERAANAAAAVDARLRGRSFGLFTLSLNYLQLGVFGAQSPKSGATTPTAHQLAAHKAVEHPL